MNAKKTNKKLENAREIAAEIKEDYPGWKDGLPDCPCDENEIKKSEEFEISNFSIDKHHPGAENCYRSSDPLSYQNPNNPEITAAPGQQCCYDEMEKLITNGPGAGTPDLYSPSRKLNAWNHYQRDVKPYKAMELEEYHETWSPNNGNNCRENPALNSKLEAELFESQEPKKIAVVYFTGFSGQSSEKADNIAGMKVLDSYLKNRLADDSNIQYEGLVYNHYKVNKAIKDLEVTHYDKLVVVGHSFGADSAIEFAQKYEQKVDLLVQVDSVGIGDDELPDNVNRGINYFQKGDKDWLVEREVERSLNVNLEEKYGVELSHTEIDNYEKLHKEIGEEIERLSWDEELEIDYDLEMEMDFDSDGGDGGDGGGDGGDGGGDGGGE